jgi:hypothetical protein
MNPRKVIRDLLFLATFCTFLIVGTDAEAAVTIPDPSRDHAFLYNEWRPDRATVVVFIDPLCPYCKKAIPRFDQITQYNLFVYWAPIFGQRSEDTVRPFFRCEKPTAATLLHSLTLSGASEGDTPVTCEGAYSDSLRAINDEMVASYPINGVPAYFLQGVPTSLSSVQATQTGPPKYVNGVAINWQRYKESKIEDGSPGGSLAVITSKNSNVPINRQLLEKYHPEYLFSANDRAAACDASLPEACAAAEELRAAQSRQYSEIVALLGVYTDSGQIYLLSKEGSLTSITIDTDSVLD